MCIYLWINWAFEGMMKGKEKKNKENQQQQGKKIVYSSIFTSRNNVSDRFEWPKHVKL